MNDSLFISKTVALALKGKFNTKPGVNVGCVIVKNNKIIGQGFYEEYGGSHAEINAINDDLTGNEMPLIIMFVTPHPTCQCPTSENQRRHLVLCYL